MRNEVVKREQGAFMVMCCAKLGDNLTARALINGETVDDNYDDLGFVPY